MRHVKLFDALNQMADAMRMRWSKEDNWVRFRTIDDYNERLREIPNRLLERWAASRKEHGALTLLVAGLSPEQRRQAQTAVGLPFTQMSLAQQQGFLNLAVERDQLQRLRPQDLAGASLRVQYMPASEYQWLRPAAPGSPLSPSPVHARTREAALAAARRIDPRADMTEIVPNDVNLVFLYIVSGAQSRRVAFR